MPVYFNEDGDKEYMSFKDDSEDAMDENEMARLASMHENEILDDDGSILNEPDNTIEGDPEELIV